ncbi:NTP transferase domain-containing protein [Fuerstiella marisgermanici]|uniref:Bifunctional protein GlmU n=1 Tax=Fuerstiella marisgermanici TaxID=1891926 RepID=A0A1P8WKZ4_9PLAN|nr:NTP transferase domain-containing protein [Fuerstiella marisgermanici]APZ94717.1 Bifunctional protein GlmU [Fuerstiella marisgermanici]
MTAPVAVILAAGKSTRMKSETPKVLHPVCGRLMIDYVLDAARAAGVEKSVVIVGHKADLVREALASHSDVVFAEQVEQNGTGHAVMMAERELKSHQGSVLILAGDTPLLQGSSLKALLDAQASEKAACVIGTADTENNEGLGRVVRTASGDFDCIVEHKDASEDQRRITEINTGCYAFDTQLLLSSLRKLKPNNVQSEYYLTDCPRILMDDGHKVAASCSLTIEEAIGVNNRIQLAEVRSHIQREHLNQIMLSGVTIVDPTQTSIDINVAIGSDTVINPGCVIEGDVTIGANCVIGPHAHIVGPKTIADGSHVGR